MMSNLTERDRRTLRFGAFAVGAILAYILIGFPLMGRWEALNEQLAATQQELRDLETGINDAAAAGTALARLRSRATLHTDRAALNQQTARMRQQVQSLPGFKKLAVQRIEDLPLRTDEELARSGVSLQFAGTLQGLHQFLRELDAATPALKVERLTVTTGAQDTARVEGQMVVNGYALVLEPRAKTPNRARVAGPRAGG